MDSVTNKDIRMELSGSKNDLFPNGNNFWLIVKALLNLQFSHYIVKNSF